MLRKLYALILIFYISCILCNAENVTIQIIQHEDVYDQLNETTKVFEDTVIDTLFDAGVVVSNVNALAWSKGQISDRELKKSLLEARDGYAQYFVLFDVFYKSDKGTNPDAARLSHIENVSWKIYTVEKNTQAANGKAVPPPITLANDTDTGVVEFGRGASKEVVTKIASFRKK